MPQKPAVIVTVLLILLTFTACSEKGRNRAGIYSITDYGARGDGIYENAVSIQKAIDAAAEAGGGKVLVPAGEFRTSTIFLKSNTTLHLEKGATIIGSPNYESYPDTIKPLYETYLLYPGKYPSRVLIAALDAENVTIEGEGTIDGNGRHPNLEMPRPDRPKAINLIRFIKCRNVRVEGLGKKLMIQQASHWALQPINVDGLTIRNVHIKNYGGCTPDGLPICDSKNVLVENCIVESDDDALTLKSGTPEIVMSNIVVRNCSLMSRVHGFKFGTQTWGGFEDIKVIDCFFRGASRPPATKGNPQSGVFVNIGDGGYIDGLTVSDCIMDSLPAPFNVFIGKRGREYWPGKAVVRDYGSIRNLTFRNIKATENIGQFGVMIEGRRQSKIRNVRLENFQMAGAGGGKIIQPVPELPEEYPDIVRVHKGNTSVWGLFIRHAEGIELDDVYLWTRDKDVRPDIYTENVRSFERIDYKPQVRPY